MSFFNRTSFRISELVTREYSTSFYSATRLLQPEIREAIFSIYGFVRFADEIVDTLHEHNKENLLNNFESDYYEAYREGLSLNPILHSFQLTVKKYSIDDMHIQAFLKSMREDLTRKSYSTTEEMNGYIYGSADVVGLMCLKIFCRGDAALYSKLKDPAMRLGSAFQKVNFLRDLGNDLNHLDRRYFPELVRNRFDEEAKTRIIINIEEDFKEAVKGIRQLPPDAKQAVTLAYFYYISLLKKLKRSPAQKILTMRMRTSNSRKWLIVLKSFVFNKLGII
ncbi:MAG: phytoene/squalene synthase family protein [Bacteroidales bacterium]